MPIELTDAAIELTLPAEPWTAVLVRDELAELGHKAGADAERVEDAELAVAEALFAALRRSARGHRTVDVNMRRDGRDLLCVIRHRLRRKLLPGRGLFQGNDGKLAAMIVEGITEDFEVRGGGGRPTEIVMRFAVEAGSAPGYA